MLHTIKHMARVFAGAVGAMVIAVTAVSAQVNTALLTGVNVDFDTIGAAGSGQPSILFGGAIGQTGYWNPIRSAAGATTTYNLRNPANSADVLEMRLLKPLATLWLGELGPASGDAGLLINDYLDIGQPEVGATTVQLTSLPVGIYDLAVYAVDPLRDNQSTIVEVRSPIAAYGATPILGPVPASGGLVDQVTHRRLRFAHLRAESLTIDLRGGTRDGLPRFGTLNGLQIKKLTPTRLFVKPSRTGEGSGLDWTNALGNLRAALEIARVTPSVTEIWVAAGTYDANDFLISSTDRNETFLVRGNLSVYGGFAGTEGSITQRPGNLVTKLSGVNQQYHTVVVDGQSNVLLDGLTIADGFNDLNLGLAGVFSGGPGLFVENNASNIIVRNCVFVNNNAPAGASGAIGIAFNSSLVLEDCQIYGNQASKAAAVGLYNGSSLIMRRCSITNNIGGGFSGGILGGSVGGSVTLENCLLANNTLRLNLIDFSTVTGTVTLRNCTIARNRGLTDNLVGIAVGRTPTILNCLITENAGPSGFSGPGSPTALQILNGATGGQIFDNSIQSYAGEFGTEPATGNNSTEPRFVDPLPPGAPGGLGAVAVSRYELASRSPIRDSGFNGNAATLATDLKGAARLVDDPYMPNRGFAGGFVDRGCLEAATPSAICPGDVGGEGAALSPDGVRDNNDFVVFIGWFFAGDSRADVGLEGAGIGSDGVFDNNDFVVFIQFFFEPCP